MDPRAKKLTPCLLSLDDDNGTKQTNPHEIRRKHDPRLQTCILSHADSDYGFKTSPKFDPQPKILILGTCGSPMGFQGPRATPGSPQGVPWVPRGPQGPPGCSGGDPMGPQPMGLQWKGPGFPWEPPGDPNGLTPWGPRGSVRTRAGPQQAIKFSDWCRAALESCNVTRLNVNR